MQATQRQRQRQPSAHQFIIPVVLVAGARSAGTSGADMATQCGSPQTRRTGVPHPIARGRTRGPPIVTLVGASASHATGARTGGPGPSLGVLLSSFPAPWPKSCAIRRTTRASTSTSTVTPTLPMCRALLKKAGGTSRMDSRIYVGWSTKADTTTTSRAFKSSLHPIARSSSDPTGTAAFDQPLGSGTRTGTRRTAGENTAAKMVTRPRARRMRHIVSPLTICPHHNQPMSLSIPSN